MAKQTALILQLANVDGRQRQQMIVLPNNVVFRRSLTESSRTQWRYANTDKLAEWVANYTLLAKASAPDPMSILHGCVLMEVTPDEVAEMEASTLPRNVGLRYTRVTDAMTADPAAYPPTEQDKVEQWLTDWIDAHNRGDETWLTAHQHERGGTAAATPAPAVVTEPEPVVESPNPYGWTYPPIVDGFVTRPNGERYRTRELEGKVDVELLREARLHGDHGFLWGDPGTGKTALVDSAFGTDLVTMLGTEDTEKADFVGGYVPTGKPGKYRWEHGAMIEAMLRGVPLFVDECGVISPRTMTVLFSMMDGRGRYRVTDNPKIGEVVAQPGFFVLLATNPHAPGVRVSEALTSRVGLSIEVGTDYPMMRTLGVPDSAVTVAENLLTRRKSDNNGLWVPQARELLRYRDQVERYSEPVAIRNLIAAAPEDDREVVIEVVKRVTGIKYSWLTL